MLQHNTILVWLVSLLVVAWSHLQLVTASNHQFISRQPVANTSSSYQCQPQPSKCNYFDYYGAKVFNNHTLLRMGFCATYDERTRLVSLSACPFFQPNSDYLMSKDECNAWYIQLPDKISELNDYMCGPMNRKGRVCSECKDGFGPAIASIGFQIQCSNCTASGWYGILLYMFLEIVPVTIFYFMVILVFQINITSAPMTCFIMYSQLIPIWWNFAFDGEDYNVSRQMFVLNHQTEFFRNIILAVYDLWNLRFFYSLMPPICISNKLKPLYLTLLAYFSIFYPMFLILLSWILIKVHGCNFKPLVWLWRPMHRCFVRLRRGWNKTSDIIDVFSTFFLLSFSKVLYQTVLFVPHLTIWLHCCDTFREKKIVINTDLNVEYGSREHLLFGIPALLLCFIFSILPATVLTLYPVRLFRKCLSKCKLDGLTLNTFVEKFYGCYRNGLDGGRDMRSFAGLYFVVRAMPFFAGSAARMLKISENDPYLPRSVVYIAISLVIALCQPYRKMYMNVLDSLLLAHLGVLCHLMSSYSGFAYADKFVYTSLTMIALPLIFLMLYFIQRAFRKFVKSSGFERFFGKCKTYFRRNTQVTNLLSTHTVEQPLIDSTCTCASYGTES